ncbi:prepilin-type N-terminal cleavage/methylation domain-containing protein [Salinicola corii]|uniref:Type II secretion system protein H n=1 Tax=Salinicola corii TaxID=2606937 RepID=A0A640WB96_9GAMM|nr:GspH/FimT family pseudopilin [Salinicola corii]KAA0016710.1 prepilin-type N-terminal cleavage/methylation domain-containing protein [Salinicola corii]
MPPIKGSEPAPHRQRGFTLLELMITLAMMAMVAGISFAASGWIEAHRLRMETQALQQRLEGLRQLSVTTRSSWRLCPISEFGNTSECGDDWQAGYQWNTMNGNASRLAGRHEVDGVTLSWNAGGALAFNSAPWQINGANGSFTLCNDSGSNKIIINDADRVRVEYDIGNCPPSDV